MPARKQKHASRSVQAQRSARKHAASHRASKPHQQSQAPRHAAVPRAGQEGFLDKDVVTLPVKDTEVTLTRRHFLVGAAGLAALLVVGNGVSFAVEKITHDPADDIAVLDVPESAVTASDDLSEVSADSCMALVGRFELPYGTLLWANSSDVAACLIPGDTAKPLTQVSLLWLGNGVNNVVLKQAVGQDDGFNIYDVRATTGGVVWVEADILDGVWRVYTAALSGSSLGDAVLAEEGDSQWETPSIAAVGNKAFWQVLPRLDGDRTKDPSLLKRCTMGGQDVETAYSSNGRMATPLYGTADSVVFAPRAETSNVNYQLTRMDAATGEVKDTLVLPSSMRPLEAGYGETGFMFSFDAIYNYGGGIANLGTYTPAAAATRDTYSDSPWFRFARNPTAPPAWCGKYLMVKSNKSVCAVDMAGQSYCALSVQSGSDDWGDYLATTGTHSKVVTFANVDYTPIDGDPLNCCLVRVYSAR